jgi:hypothetical protein
MSVFNPAAAICPIVEAARIDGDSVGLGTRHDGPSLKPTRFFDGRHWEEAQRKRIAEGATAPCGFA